MYQSEGGKCRLRLPERNWEKMQLSGPGCALSAISSQGVAKKSASVIPPSEGGGRLSAPRSIEWHVSRPPAWTFVCGAPTSSSGPACRLMCPAACPVLFEKPRGAWARCTQRGPPRHFGDPTIRGRGSTQRAEIYRVACLPAAPLDFCVRCSDEQQWAGAPEDVPGRVPCAF